MRTREIIDVVLHPGEHCAGHAGYRMRTLLGSCVSITLWHPQRRLGAMSHILLHGRPNRPPGELDGRYAGEALSLMLRDLARWGVRPQDCEAKLFGGANMFPGQTRTDALQIGRCNGEAARELMRAHAIPVVSESLFGVGHRNVIFHVASGHVWSRQVGVAPPESPVPHPHAAHPHVPHPHAAHPHLPHPHAAHAHVPHPHLHAPLHAGARAAHHAVLPHRK